MILSRLKNRFDPGSSITSERMRKIRNKGTRIEKAMESVLNEMELRFEKQPKLLGHPDFLLEGKSVVIFCDSSFWHGRNPDDVSGKNFKRNRELWVEKLTKTIERDKKVNMELTKMGWKILRFWDDEILKFPEECKRKILNEIKGHK